MNNTEASLRKKRMRLVILGVVVVSVLMLAIVLLIALLPKGTGEIRGLDRIECPNFRTKSECQSAGCVYNPVKDAPSCYMEPHTFGFNVISVSETKNGMSVELESKKKKTPYGDSFQKAVFEVTYITENIVRFKISELTASEPRYEVPVQDTFSLLRSKTTVDRNKTVYEVSSSAKSETFTFSIKRKNGTKLWDTEIGGLVLSNQYLQIATYLPSSHIYGLGEHVRDSFKHNMDYQTWPMFARDRSPEKEHINLYGVHPFYTCLEEDGKSHGVLLLNSNAMEVTLLPSPAISFRTIGGVLDFFVFVGDNPEHVVQIYTSLIGRPMLPPYWSLGFQLSRYGYNKLDNIKTVIENTRAASIAQDVQFLDIDHMDGNRDFTWNSDSFGGLPEYIRKTQDEYGLKWIIILDPAIEAKEGYEPYESGVEDKVFIKRSKQWKPTMFPLYVRDLNFTYGKVWPRNITAFPDFFLDVTRNWWIKNIVDHHKEIPFDGLWIDMNEPANFMTNDISDYCKWQNIPIEDCWFFKCPTSPNEDPVYNPLLTSGTKKLSEMTLCMESLQGLESNTYRHYDVHSLYGWSQTEPTLEAAQQATGTRSLVISRSTYPSSGRHCGHWLGDNKSRWEDMRRSIVGMLDFNLFGIPYIGADVCGFSEDTTPELCKRWMQLGAFYPFFRNHNGIGQKEQDPVALGDVVIEASKRAVERRYNLLPYLYTLFYRAHVDGNTVVRPLFHEFPEDEVTFTIDRQFLWGKSLLISPILKEGESSSEIYLPEDEWWHFKKENSSAEKMTGHLVIKTAVDDNIPLHIRGGSIIPTQQYALRNKYEVKNISLYVFPKENKASGELFVDDGISKDTVTKKAYILYQFSYENCSLDIKNQEGTDFDGPQPILIQVFVFKSGNVSSVSVGDSSLSDFSVKEQNRVLIMDVNKYMKDVKKITWKNSEDECDMLP